MNKKLVLENVTCENLTYEGYGSFKWNNVLYLIENFLPGEVANIEITKSNKNIVFGKTIDILKTSNKRIEPKNKNLLISGAASLTNMSYSNQIKWKDELLKYFFGRNLPNIAINSIVESPLQWNYRNKIIVFFNYENGFFKIGLYEKNSQKIIEQNSYDLVDKEIEKIILWIQNNIQQFDNECTQNIDNVLLRIGKNNSIQIKFNFKKQVEIDETFFNKLINNFSNIVYLEFEFNKLNKSRNSTMVFYINDLFIMKLAKNDFIVSLESFFQINTKQTENILNYLFLKNEFFVNKKIIDLYCGVGSLGISLSTKSKFLYGIEINKHSIESAIKNTKINNVLNSKFVCKDASKIVKNDLYNFDTIILDPPRAGLNKHTIKLIKESNIERIVYMSCNFHTLIRDLVDLQQNYKIIEIQPFDMFPQTPHIECVALMHRVKS